MPILNRIAELHADMTTWRHDIHAHPEMAFKEHRTSDFVAAKLTEFGVPIERGLAGTGVVGTLRCGSGERAIALRADMDALPIQEKTGHAHASTHDGVDTVSVNQSSSGQQSFDSVHFPVNYESLDHISTTSDS